MKTKQADESETGSSLAEGRSGDGGDSVEEGGVEVAHDWRWWRENKGQRDRGNISKLELDAVNQDRIAETLRGCEKCDCQR